MAKSFYLYIALLTVPFSSSAAAGDQKTLMVDLDGKWFKAWQSVERRFDVIEKKDLNCYRITAYQMATVLKIEFIATPYPGFEHYRGQPPACGPSISFEVDKQGKIILQKEIM